MAAPVHVTSTTAVVAASARVEYGAGAAVLLSRRARNGRVVLDGLLPGTRYVVRSVGATSSFRTLPARTTNARVGRGGAITVDGSPFLPVMQWLQCPSLFSLDVSLGVNTFLGRGCDDTTDVQEVAALRALGAYSVLPYDAAVARAPALLGWRFDDEPDQKGITPDEIAKQRHPGRLHFLTVTSRFDDRHVDDVYRAYARATDVIGFDLYPVTGWCRPDWLRRVYDDQRALVALAQGKPTYQWIEAISTSSRFCRGRGVTAAELRAEVWLALAGGAKAVGYFTHSWRPTYSQFRVSAPVRAAMRRTNRELAAYAPALLARPVPLSANVPAIARTLHGATYVFAVNERRERATARIAVAGRSVVWALPPLGVRIARLY